MDIRRYRRNKQTDAIREINFMYSRGYSVGVEDSSVNRRLRHLRGKLITESSTHSLRSSGNI